MELKIQVKKVTGEVTILYEGDFDIKQYMPAVMPKIDLNNPESIETAKLIFAEISGQKIEFFYNNGTIKNRKEELVTFLKNAQYNLNYSTFEGKIDNNLEIAGNRKTTDISDKVAEMMPNAPDTVKQTVIDKINRVIAEMDEINKYLETHKPSDTKLGYRFRHHFPSPEEYKKSKS
jgi:hypothetical protein